MHAPIKGFILTNKEAFKFAIDSIAPLMGEEEARANIKFLFLEKYNLSQTALLTNESSEFTDKVDLELTLKRLHQYEPLQYIIGHTYFSDLKINVNPSVLIPRPETEELVNIVKPYITHESQIIADICTGSGCIALSIRKWFPNNKIIATDISLQAIETAKSSEQNNFTSSKIQFELNDVLKQEWPFQIPNIVVCNPPYIERSESQQMEAHVLQHEPHLALFVDHPDPLLFYKSVVQTFLTHKFPTIFFEMNPIYVEAMQHYCQLHQLKSKIVMDMQGKERFAIISK